MNNKYFEFSVKPKNESREKAIKNVLFILKIIAILATVVFGYFAFMFSNLMWVFFVILLTVALVLNYFQHKFYNFYDLIFVDGDVSVSKIVNNVKRKPLIKFSAKNVDKIGVLGGQTYNLYVKDKAVKKIFISENLTERDVCFLINATDGKTLLILPYNENLIVQILKYGSTSKLEKGFIDKVKGNL